ncbi:MAG TPA: AAA family ATPase [Ktedonobacteraceae bacterium]|nr:AAA family ATPase [Ktedonobacteraceae bacterium]
MSVPVIAFFNNKGGVGKTSLVYHLAWMYADFGLRVVAADLDPQANLTAAFLDEERLEVLWPDDNHPQTVYGSISPLLKGTGDIATPHIEYVDNQQPSLFGSPIALLVGDLSLSRFEDQLSDMWPRCLDKDERAFRVISAFWRIMQEAATLQRADIILMDLGPNLGAINRAALIAADHVVIPLSPDLFSLQGLRNLGPTLRNWRREWEKRLKEWEDLQRQEQIQLALPPGSIQPIGYVVLQHAVRLDRPVRAYDRWIEQIPLEYQKAVQGKSATNNVAVRDDPNHLALLKHYRSLMPLAQEARKPMFHLKPADGAIGSHMQAVQGVYRDFRHLAESIAQRISLVFPKL